MKQNHMHTLSVITIMLATLAGTHAQTTRFWSANGSTQGGTGTWNTTDLRWGTAAGGPFTAAWNNTTFASDTATFGGTGGTVTLDGITAFRALSITSNDYVIGSGTVTSNIASGGVFINTSHTGNATVNTSMNFSTGGAINVRAFTNTATDGTVLNLGGNYAFTGSAGTKAFDLEAITNNTQTINFTGNLSGLAGSTVQLRIGFAGGAAGRSNNATFNLHGNNSYDNLIAVRGTTVLHHNNAAGLAAMQIGATGTETTSTVRVLTSGARTIANNISLGGGEAAARVIGGSTADFSTFSGNITKTGTFNAATQLTAVSGGTVEFTGNFGGMGSPLEKTGAGTVILSGNNALGGTVAVTAGTLNLNPNSAAGSGTIQVGSSNTAASSTVSLVTGGARTISNAIQLAGNIEATRILGSGTADFSTFSGNITKTGVFNAATQVTAVSGGTVEFTGIFGGMGSPLEKVGAGTVILSGNNTLGGQVNVTQGTLLVNNTAGSGTGGGNVVTSANTILGGNGTVGGYASINGRLAPGSGGIGTLTVNNGVTWSGSAGNSWLFELGAGTVDLAAAFAATDSDLLSLAGNFVKAGSVWNFDFQNTGSLGWFKLVDFGGTTTFDGSEFTYSNLASGLSGSFVLDSGTTALYVNVVPEPSSAALLSLGVAAVALLRRRRA